MRCLVERDSAAAEQLVEADVAARRAGSRGRTPRRRAHRTARSNGRRPSRGHRRARRSRGWSSESATMRRISRGACAGSPKSGEIEPLSLLPEMAKMAAGMVHDVLDGIRRARRRKSESRLSVATMRSTISTKASSGRCSRYMMENPQNIGPSTTLLFVAKNLERIGDHATNIAEMVYFAATGERAGGGCFLSSVTKLQFVCNMPVPVAA